MQRNSLRQYLNLLAAIAAITVNTLAVTLPLNGLDTAEISDRFRVYFVPAGYVFSIWSFIYLGWISFIIFQFRSTQQASPRLRRLGYWFALSCVFNAAWLFCWHYELFDLSVIVMLALLTTLIISYLRLDVGRLRIGAAERWAVDVPFGMYLGWISVATIANISDYLYLIQWDGFGLSPQLWAVIMLAVASVLGIAMAISRRDAAYTLVLAWAFAGIAVKQWDSVPVAIAALAAAALALTMALLAVARRRAPLGNAA
jgi:benzodiazapine receptor